MRPFLLVWSIVIETSFVVMLSDESLISLSESLSSEKSYQQCCVLADQDPVRFWAALGNHYLDWDRPFETSMLPVDSGSPQLHWFDGGKLNLTTNCLDRHLASGNGDQQALIWEGDDGSQRIFSYREMLQQVCAVSHALHGMGLGQGDVVAIYMPLLPEAIFAVLACNRIGVIPCPLYSGLSGQALAVRLHQLGAQLLITVNNTLRNNEVIPLRPKVMLTQSILSKPIKVVEVQRTLSKTPVNHGWIDWTSWTAGFGTKFESVQLEASSTAFMIHTSGTTGTPKLVQHQLGGALLACHLTTRWCFNAKAGDVHWCTADLGWITSMAHVIYGPLSNGLTTVIFEGSIVSPGSPIAWNLIERHRVNKLKIAPTAIRALRRDWMNPIEQFDLNSLDVVFSSGEPLDPSSLAWIESAVLAHAGSVVDGWGQTETCSTMICSIPGSKLKHNGSVGRPLPGAHFEIVSMDQQPVADGVDGFLRVIGPWPGLCHEKNLPTPQTPLSTGDVARKDADGSFKIVGRHDDVVNVSGHRISTVEVQEAIKAHPAIAEAAAVGRPHEIKGQSIATFVTLSGPSDDADSLELDVRRMVSDFLGPYAAPSDIFVVSDLPRTHSGKLAKGYLMKLAAQEHLKSIIDVSMIQNTNILAELEAEVLHRDKY